MIFNTMVFKKASSPMKVYFILALLNELGLLLNINDLLVIVVLEYLAGYG